MYLLLLPLFLLYLSLLSYTAPTRTLNIIRFHNNNKTLKKKDDNNNLQDDYLRLIVTRSTDRLDDQCVNCDSLMISPLFTML